MHAALAALPLLAVLIAMAGLGLSAAKAGALGLATALVLGLAAFDLAVAAPGGAPAALAGALAEAGFTTLTILWILLPALALHALQDRSGAVLRIRDALAGLTADRRAQTILIAWFFGLFVEGAAGFGTPVALAAPLLAGLGHPPLRAVLLALLGHAAGVSFGAVGTPALAQVAIGGLDPRALAGTTAGLHAVLAPILLWMVVRLADDAPMTRADHARAALAAAAFLVPSVALAALTGPELATLGGALAGAVLFVLTLGGKGRTDGARLATLLPDLAPYLAIVALILATRLIPPLRDATLAPMIAWTLPGGFGGSVAPLHHPGTMLVLGLILGALATRRATLLGPALGEALRRLPAVALALAAMLALSRLMVHGGMIDALAAAAATAGPAWPLLAPFVGVLGSFITGSATASNILFTDLQLITARALALPDMPMAAAQSLGSAIGNIVAPHNIVAGAATVGLTGREGAVMRQTLVPCALYAGLAGALLWALVR